jgi:hypothetical protein
VEKRRHGLDRLRPALTCGESAATISAVVRTRGRKHRALRCEVNESGGKTGIDRRGFPERAAEDFIIPPAGRAHGYAGSEKLNIGVVLMGGSNAQTFHGRREMAGRAAFQNFPSRG